MTSIGECLRSERLRRNLQLEQIANELKISARMLAAIEAEDFEKLPGGVFAKSFVRQYAHVLGLDEEEMAAEVDRVLHPGEAVQSVKPETAPIPLPRMDAWQSVGDSRSRASGWSSVLPALLLVVVVMLICSGIYAFWQRPRHAAVPNQPAPSRASQPSPQPPPSGVQAAAPAASAPAAPVAAELQPSQPVEGTPEGGSASPQAADTTAAVPKPADTNSAAGTPAAPPGPVHVEITATEQVWVRLASDGKYVFSGTLEANQSRTVDANESVSLRLGNAGGVNIALNGKPIGAVGPKGQIRNVQLTSGGFQIVAPKSPPPAVVDPL
jgi:cytoskeleton protein RodZ